MKISLIDQKITLLLFVYSQNRYKCDENSFMIWFDLIDAKNDNKYLEFYIVFCILVRVPFLLSVLIRACNLLIR